MRLPLPFLLCALLLTGMPAARAQRKKEESGGTAKAPPQPVPAALTVARGASLEIPLRAYGLPAGAVRFLLRSKPERGVLSPIKIPERGAVSVTYTPPADLAVKAEKFTYAAQDANGVSAPAEVTIAITDEAPRLLTPRELKSEPVLAGAEDRQEFEIENAGGGLSEGEVIAPPPWRIDGAPAYRLKGGERRKYTLVFAPVAAGSFRSELRFSSQPDRATPVAGEARERAAFAVPALKLTEAADGTRGGTAELVNESTEELVFTLQGSPRLHLPVSLTVPPKGKAALPVRLEPADVAAVQEEVAARAGELRLTLPVTGAAAKARLQVTPERVRMPAESNLAVENRGGTTGHWKAEADAPFTLTPAEFQLLPRETKALALGSSAPGPQAGLIRFTGEQQSLEIVAEIAGPALEGARPANPARIAPGKEAAAPEAENRPHPALNVIAGSRVIAWTAHGVNLRWPALVSAGRPVRVEYRSGLELDAAQQLREVWKPVSSATFRSEGTDTIAELRGLRPGTLYTFRIGLSGASAETAPLFVIDAATSPGTDLFAVTPLRAGLVVLLILGGIYFYRRHQGLG